MEDFIKEDKFGNTISVKNNCVMLTLFGRNEIKNIGFIAGDNYIKGTPNLLEWNRHRFKKANAWGVNYVIVQALQDSAKVIIHTDRGNYECSKGAIIKSGCMMFSRAGYELQYMVPIDLWKRRY